uniref:Globin family profile domain-containing protein n=1 Tax=Ditylenchus dipsaci TaxID=166011 RepID=A0A915E6G6_9BILA
MDTGSAFRRTQSLRYPKGSQCGASSSLAGNNLSRKGSKLGARSKSSRNRLSADSQSSLSRLTFSQRMALFDEKNICGVEVVAPKVKDIFYKAALVDCFVNKEQTATAATMDEHVKLFFDDLIANMDCENETIAMIKKVGQHHAILNTSCGFHADIWEHLGEITMEKYVLRMLSRKREKRAELGAPSLPLSPTNLDLGLRERPKHTQDDRRRNTS